MRKGDIMVKPKGRPKETTGELMSEQKSMNFSKEDMALIKRVAKSKRISSAALIRLAVFDFLKREGEIK